MKEIANMTPATPSTTGLTKAISELSHEVPMSITGTKATGK
ncbi:hypothetical protein LPPLD21_02910 [Lactiplantibacillus paraplantarum]|uniref:Uncharacterized protein n=1 Tax=Lactiplantibacillus paraplantarum TaxID=60520 RepID=A0ABQ0NE37_9LACO|nr:hypothetical protein [Lactiplantibacillus paraplantarum]GBF03340.1 hypothetical protein LPPLD21_02910 [Lactiplantibacillus paraplantarum]